MGLPQVYLPPGTHTAPGLSRLRESIVLAGWASRRETVLTNQPGELYFIDAAAKALSLRGLTLRPLGSTEGAVRQQVEHRAVGSR